jgi:branched-chain amino acid transport system substrate-binding protein
MVIDLTGPTKVYGDVDLASMQASAKYWNAHGGIDGHPVTITSINDNGDESTAVSVATQYLGTHPKPNMIFAGTSGIDSGGLIPLVKRDHLLDIAVDDGGSVCVKSAQAVCPTAFIPGPGPAFQQLAVAHWFKQHGFTKVGILQEEDAFSQSETPILQANLKSLGIQSAVASYSPTALDVKPEISELKSAGVQAMYGEALAAPAGYIATGRAELGLVNSLPLVFDYGAGAVDLTKLAPAADLKNAYEAIAKSSDPYVNMPGRVALLANSTPAVSAQPLIVASFEWQDLLEAHLAAQQANSIAEDSMVSALNNLSASAQQSSLNMTAPAIEFTPGIHEDMSPAGYNATEVVPVGPLANGTVQYKQSSASSSSS